MDFRDIISLIFILAGVLMLIIARVLKHKGMWDLGNDDMLFSSRRGFDTPYAVADTGVILICAGIIGTIGFNFGLKAGGWALAVTGAGAAAFNLAVRLRRVDRDDKDAYSAAVAAVIISVCAFLLGLFLAYMA